ncbi:methyl-accepting chemotaxis protein [Desulfovibrio inopinatus]|uniref:methyl-accepting chemotaxis protein n=1 Tax=Desulfovibrio inopinatus TaxID=102109 RepID=UPI00146FC7AF|nr:methyl-accepting chemotaxis protein [Desulfovibrio inopinatus]
MHTDTSNSHERTEIISQKESARFFSSCSQALGKLEHALSQAITKREDDFLALGEALGQFHVESTELSELASHVVELTSGPRLRDAVEGLTNELERMSALSESTTGQDSLVELASIDDITKHLHSAMGEFSRIVKRLSMLGISTRIESARLGSKGMGFSTLSDDVEKLAANIIKHSEQIVSQSKSLEELIVSARKRTELLVESQKGYSKSLIDELMLHLETLIELMERSEALSARLTQNTKEIAEKISDAVLSMQFHDIVRQQVEHVEEALRDVLNVIRDPNQFAFSQGDIATTEREIIAWIKDVCQIQVSQLDHGEASFVHAVDTFRTNIQGIAGHILDIGQDITELTASGGREGSQVLDRLDSGIGRIMDGLRAFAEQGDDIGRIMKSVAGTVIDMSSFVSEIEEVGSEIELIAINASIKAAHTGEEGKALGVLASAIQQLSVQARRQTDAVGSVLSDVSSSSDILQANAEAYHDMSQVESMVATLKSLASDIKQVKAEVDENFIRLHDKSEYLGSAVNDAADQIHFHHEVARTLSSGRAVLQKILDNALHLVPHETDENRPERLKELLKRYTMEVERSIHENASGEKSESDDIELFTSDDSTDLHDDLGDNVELF